jgi:hypothetical protein
MRSAYDRSGSHGWRLVALLPFEVKRYGMRRLLLLFRSLLLFPQLFYE